MPYKDVLKVKPFVLKMYVGLVDTKKCRNAFRDNEGSSRMTSQIINELTSRKIHRSPLKEIKFDNSSIKDLQELSSSFDDHWTYQCHRTEWKHSVLSRLY